MNIEIINIGDELLIGQVINTNAAWMAQELNMAGFFVQQFTVIRDDRQHILQALQEAGTKASVVLISGGIGPTKDDITKTTLCEFFGTGLHVSTAALNDIEALFRRRGWGFPLSELNRKQAELPENCTELPNKLGTARGMWFEKEFAPGRNVIFVSMPGVPFEMQAMMTGEIIPRLRKIFDTPSIAHKTILTQGIGESLLAEIISSWENALPPDLKLAYLPQPGIVRLRLTGSGRDEKNLRKMIETEVEKLNGLIPEYIYGYDEDKLEEIVGRILKEKNQSLGTAESCTGGYIAHLLTSIPGSSEYYKGSVVAYANEVKESVLGVSGDSLKLHGAVSEAVASEMALGLRKKLGVDWAVAVTGIAGPDGGTSEKPVGTTWIAVAGPGGIVAKHYLFGDNRERNIRRTALQALNNLRKAMQAEK